MFGSMLARILENQVIRSVIPRDVGFVVNIEIRREHAVRTLSRKNSDDLVNVNRRIVSGTPGTEIFVPETGVSEG